MVNISELVAKIIRLTKEEKIFWRSEILSENRARYQDVDIFFSDRWSFKDFLWINGTRVEIDEKNKTQLSNAILEMRRHFAGHKEEKKKQRYQEGIKILMEA